MNLVMQLRKVCNHPELFERRPARSPFSFQQLYYYTGYIPIRAGDIKLIASQGRNPISFCYPKMVYDSFRFEQPRKNTLKRLLNIYHPANQLNNKTFSGLSMTCFRHSEINLCFQEDPLYTAILLTHWWKRSTFSSGISTKETLNINIDLKQEIDYRFKLKSIN